MREMNFKKDLFLISTFIGGCLFLINYPLIWELYQKERKLEDVEIINIEQKEKNFLGYKRKDSYIILNEIQKPVRFNQNQLEEILEKGDKIEIIFKENFSFKGNIEYYHLIKIKKNNYLNK